ncbi:hypothetical protein [Bremerella alba]|uniref:Uncharacterized protein n=1 Tax=Bremerella alba TaxID=980252 RepID=A0A7V8V9F6_9BACT|nr:hypothetical protein [Bremerella alba]MBA2117330.1 hypothetical protein [Bremerella alba]
MPLEQINNNERKFVNETLTIESNNYEVVHAGMYHALFKGLEALETDYGKAYRWSFLIVGGEYDGKYITELSDNEKAPSTQNKTGRFLCALAKRNIEKGVQVNPSDYVDKKYMLIVEPHLKKAGETKITTFSMID